MALYTTSQDTLVVHLTGILALLNLIIILVVLSDLMVQISLVLKELTILVLKSSLGQGLTGQEVQAVTHQAKAWSETLQTILLALLPLFKDQVLPQVHSTSPNTSPDPPPPCHPQSLTQQQCLATTLLL